MSRPGSPPGPAIAPQVPPFPAVPYGYLPLYQPFPPPVHAHPHPLDTEIAYLASTAESTSRRINKLLQRLLEVRKERFGFGSGDRTQGANRGLVKGRRGALAIEEDLLFRALDKAVENGRRIQEASFEMEWRKRGLINQQLQQNYYYYPHQQPHHPPHQPQTGFVIESPPSQTSVKIEKPRLHRRNAIQHPHPLSLSVETASEDPEEPACQSSPASAASTVSTSISFLTSESSDIENKALASPGGESGDDSSNTIIDLRQSALAKVHKCRSRSAVRSRDQDERKLACRSKSVFGRVE